MKLMDGELSYSLTYKDVVDIIKIIDDASCHELQIELEDLKLKIVKRSASDAHVSATASVMPPVHAVSGTGGSVKTEPAPADTKKPEQGGTGDTRNMQEAAGEETYDGVVVRSPLAGNFYAAPEPGAKPFVEKGSEVEKNQQVGIVEVMKLMNSIKAPEKGIVREILVKNEETVKMGQVLMVIDPS